MDNQEIEKLIQQDLDNGMFTKICSNETTFKEYVFSRINEILNEKTDVIEELKEKSIKYPMMSELGMKHQYNNGFKDALSKAISIIKNNQEYIYIYGK